MVTQKYSPTSISIFYGLSTDTKPTDCNNGSEFHEIDTGKKYRFDEEGVDWVEFSSGSGGGGGGGGSDLDPELVSALENSWDNSGFGYSDDEVSLSMTTADEHGWIPGGDDTGIPDDMHFCIISDVDLSALYDSELENYKYSVTASINGNSFTPTTTAQGDVITCRGSFSVMDVGEYNAMIMLNTSADMVVFAVPEDYTPIEATLEVDITKHHIISENYIPGKNNSDGVLMVDYTVTGYDQYDNPLYEYSPSASEIIDAVKSGGLVLGRLDGALLVPTNVYVNNVSGYFYIGWATVPQIEGQSYGPAGAHYAHLDSAYVTRIYHEHDSNVDTFNTSQSGGSAGGAVVNLIQNTNKLDWTYQNIWDVFVGKREPIIIDYPASGDIKDRVCYVTEIYRDNSLTDKYVIVDSHGSHYYSNGTSDYPELRNA